MDLSTLRPGDTLYMVHASSLKFWEITVLDCSNHIRYGKLANGEEESVQSGQCEYSSQAEAIARAKSLVEAKMTRGYHPLHPEERGDVAMIKEPQSEFAKAVQRGRAGTYMELLDAGFISYWKMQVESTIYPATQVHVEKGVAGGRPVSWVNTYVDAEEASRAAKWEIRDKLARGFKRCEEPARRANPSPAVIEIDLDAELPPTPPLSPVKTPERASSDLLQAFAGTGLERYMSALEAENVAIIQVSIEELAVMTEDDFQRLGIPASASTKINDYIQAQVSPSQVTKRKRETDDLQVEYKKPKLQSVEVPHAIELLRPQPWDETVNPRGWLMTLAIDGVRCLWNGRELLQKSGQALPAPLFFTERLPQDTTIDVELYIDGESAKRCLALARKSDLDGWKQVKLSLFDLPAMQRPVEDRIFQLQTLAKTIDVPFLTTPIYEQCRDADHLRVEVLRASENSNCGVLLRQPGSLYDPKKSKTLFKVKKPQQGEALVVGYEPGKGKNEGLIGGLRVRLDDTKELKLVSGLSDEDRKRPPLIGTRVKFQYQDLNSAGLPKYPQFLSESKRV